MTILDGFLFGCGFILAILTAMTFACVIVFSLDLLCRKGAGLTLILISHALGCFLAATVILTNMWETRRKSQALFRTVIVIQILAITQMVVAIMLNQTGFIH